MIILHTCSATMDCDNPPDIRDIFWTCPERDQNSLFFGNGEVKKFHKKMKIEGSLTFHNCIFVLDSLAFGTG